MKPAMFIECSASFWVEVAKKAKHDLKIEPVYWVGWHYIEESLKSAFPQATFHNTVNAKRNIPAQKFEDFTRKEFTLDCQDIWEKDAQTVYDMLNRFDYSRDLSFLERQSYFYEAVIYWNAVIEELKPAIIFFPCPPHVVYDYIILALCRRKGIKTIMFDEATVMPPYCLSMNDFTEDNQILQKGYHDIMKKKTPSKLKDSTEEYIKKIRASYSSAKPLREVIAHKNLKKRTFKEKAEELKIISNTFIHESKQLIKGVKNVNSINTASLIKERKKSLKDSFEGPFSQSSYLWQTFIERNLTEKRHDFYSELCSTPDLSSKYIYLSLHGQPERTSNPQGGIFTNQLLIVNILANSIPKEWVIYVKEHPNQFHPFMYVNMYRNESFYTTFTSFPNVKLIQTNYDPFALIDNAQAVATIAGTAAIEAVLRNRPALIFGKAWYRDCNGMLQVNNLNEAKAAIKKIKAGFSVESNKVELFFKAIENYAFQGLGDPLPDWYGMTDKENINNLFKEIKKHYAV